jgi:hypothetical protein
MQPKKTHDPSIPAKTSPVLGENLFLAHRTLLV